MEEVALPAGFCRVLEGTGSSWPSRRPQFHEARAAAASGGLRPVHSRAAGRRAGLPGAGVRSREGASGTAGPDDLRSPFSKSCALSRHHRPGAGGRDDRRSGVNSPWSYTGLPTVCIPIGLSPEGLPLALQLVGQREQEAHLLEAAAWCEEALNVELGEPHGSVSRALPPGAPASRRCEPCRTGETPVPLPEGTTLLSRPQADCVSRAGLIESH